MGVNNLNSDAMLGISQILLSERKAQLLALPYAAAFVADLEAAHEALSVAQQRLRQASVGEQALQEEQRRLDERHDALARALFAAFEATILLEVDAERRTALQQLQTALFPDGLLVVSRPWVEEAGAAERREKLLTKEAKKLLDSVACGGVTGKAVAEEWVTVSRDLGRATARREELVVREQVGTGEAEPLALAEARRRWAQVVNLLVEVLRYAPMDESNRAILLATVEGRLEADAVKRRRAIGSGAPPADEAETKEPPEAKPVDAASF